MRPKPHQKLPTKRAEREKLRVKGQFWTPGWLAKAMVQYAVGSDSKRLVDPAAGNGAFLTAWEEINPGMKGCRFTGYDVDSTLLGLSVYEKPYCHVEVRDFVHSPPSCAFSSIVANPPYIRHHRLTSETKAALRGIAVRVLGKPLDGRAGLHVYFLIQALTLLAPSGRLAFIMPADTCEGVFAADLWRWITSNYRLDAVVAFDPVATPFPGVDTNALVFMIRRADPVKQLRWVRCRTAHTDDLYKLVKSGFRRTRLDGVELFKRDLREALETGLSRPEHQGSTQYRLADFAKVMRGIATGANDFFWLTKEEARKVGIPEAMLKAAVGRTRDVKGSCITESDIERLDKAGRPTLLFCPQGHAMERLPDTVQDYLRLGEELGLSERALIRTRRPWYKMEHREVPPILFAYLGRRNARFIRNQAGVVPLTGFLCVYPHPDIQDRLSDFWEILNDPEVIKNLSLVGKSYGSGAIKVEPRSLERLPIPDRLAKLIGRNGYKMDRDRHLLLFEQCGEYGAKRRKPQQCGSSAQFSRARQKAARRSKKEQKALSGDNE